VKRVDEILAAGEGALISFEGSNDEDAAFSPAETMADDTQPRIDEELCRRELRERVAGFMNALSTTERDVLKRRYGLESDASETLQDAATALKVSPETVRQAQLRAIKKIRSACKRGGIATLFASPACASV
jgi:RNA polymerase sigma factor (sigma-70 family)